MNEEIGSNITFDWQHLKWPGGLNTRNIEGEYRVVETEKNGCPCFTPQYRNFVDGDWWQDFEVRHAGRPGFWETVEFATLDLAKDWLDAAHYRRPFLAYHKYNPAA